MNSGSSLVPSSRAALLFASAFALLTMLIPGSALASIDLNERPQVRFQGQASEWLGSYVANQTCDVNGDGYDDLLLSSEKWNGNAGELTVILGSETPAGGDITSPTTGGVVRIQGSGRFGGAVDCAGDVNNDGIDDIVVGGYQYAHGSGNPGRGSAWVIFGATDFAAKALQFLPGNPGDTGYRIDGNPTSSTYNDDGLGFGVAGIGDVNGDGYDDLLLSAHLADGDGLTNSGSAYIVPGKPDTAVVKLVTPSNWLVRVKGVKANNQMRGTAAIGDINSDGIPDAAVGTNLDTPYARGSLTGSVWVIDGTTRGEFSLNALDPNHASYDATRGFRIAGQAAQGGSSYGLGIGQHIAGVGDVNGDGRPDLMSNGWHDVTQGGPPIVFGGLGNFERDLGAATWCDCGYMINGDGGSQVVGLGDVNGDGKDDVAFGNQGAANSNAAYITYGRSSFGPLDLTTMTQAQGSKLLPAAGSASAGSGSRFGTRIGQADFNGDGAVDLVVGASNANGLGRTESGEVTVVFMPSPARVKLDRETVEFGDRRIGGGPGEVETVTVTNRGEKPLEVDSVTTTGDTTEFSVVSADCSGMNPGDSLTLNGGENCEIEISFSPQSTGSKQAEVSVAATDGVHKITLSGNGTQPLAAVDRTEVDFGLQRTGLAGPAGLTKIILGNEGSAELAIASISLDGSDQEQFSLDFTDCPVGSGQLAAGGECEIEVGFQPESEGSKSASVSFQTDGGDPSVDLSGIGGSPEGGLAPSATDFGEVELDETSSRTVRLSSSGDFPLAIDSIGLSGADAADFSVEAGDCPAELVVGSSCDIEIIFAPAALGARSAELVVTSDGGELTAGLTGTGKEVSRPVSAVDLPSVDFGLVRAALSTVSGLTQVTLTNDGTAALTVDSISVTGTDPASFPLDASECEDVVLAVGGSCEVEVGFRPADIGSKAASISFETDGGDVETALVGRGGLPEGSLSRASVDLGQVKVGESADGSVILTSAGEFPLEIDSIGLAGDADGFTADADACPERLEPSATCEIQIKFAPGSAGEKTASLVVSTDVGSLTATISGKGVEADTPPECPAARITRVSGLSGLGGGQGRGVGVALRTPQRSEALVSGTGFYQSAGKRRIVRLNQVKVKVGPVQGRAVWRLSAGVPLRSKVVLNLRIRTRPTSADCTAVTGSPTFHRAVARVSRVVR